MKRQWAWSFVLAFALAATLMAWLTPIALGESVRAPAAIRMVSPTGSNTTNCTVTPCLTIGYAITQSIPGDQISVAVGTYTEHITITNGVSIYGAGWDSTIINGAFSSPATTVYVPDGISASTVISGVRITGGGSGDPLTSAGGGGMTIHGAPTIINTYLYSNTGYYGGGVYVSSASPTFNNLRAWNNRALYGGGLYLTGGSVVTITGNPGETNNGTVYYNSATQHGGGIYIGSGVTATLTGLRIQSNYAQFGGGVSIEYTPNRASIQSSDISYNNAGGGGGFNITQSSNVQVISNTIISNTTQYGGAGISFTQSDGLVKNNIVSGNVITGAGNMGGGAWIGYTSTVTVEGNLFQGNDGYSGGGGLFLTNNANALVNANTFVSNTATTGGGMMIYYASNAVTLTNNILAYNSGTFAGGVYVQEGSSRIVNNTVANNNGSGITFNSASGIQIYNNIVYGNIGKGLERTGSLTYTANYNNVVSNSVDYANVAVGSNDNTTDNPLFIGIGSAFDYYHIKATSPVSTTGSLALAPFKDIDGDVRLFGSSVSMGADEIPSPGSSLYLPLILR